MGAVSDGGLGAEAAAGGGTVTHASRLGVGFGGGVTAQERTASNAARCSTTEATSARPPRAWVAGRTGPPRVRRTQRAIAFRQPGARRPRKGRLGSRFGSIFPAVLALGLLLLEVASVSPVPAAPPARSITVTGDAEVKVAPNLVVLFLTVETVEKTIAKAKTVNDQRMGRTLEALKSAGIAPKDLQTDNLTIESVRDSGSYSKSEPDAYVVRKALVVTLREPARFEGVLTAVLEAGTNRVDDIEFRTTELRALRDQARALALKAAREKATAMAAELGMKIGKPQSISEQPSWWGMGGMRARFGGMAQNAIQDRGGGEASDTFAVGQIAVKAQVSVTFDLE